MMYACPKCKSTDLRVWIEACAVLLQDKDDNIQTSIESDHHWDNDATMLCNACDHTDQAHTFKDGVPA